MHRWSLSTHDGMGRFRDPAVTPVPCPLITARRSIQIIVPATTATMVPYATHTSCSQGVKPRQHRRKQFGLEPESLADSSSHLCSPPTYTSVVCILGGICLRGKC
jgi:hypothetical protein